MKSCPEWASYSSRITKIDLQAGTMTVETIDGKPAPPVTYAIDVNPNSPTRTDFIDLSGMAKPESFHVGDWVAVSASPDGKAHMVWMSSLYERSLLHHPELRDPDPAKDWAKVLDFRILLERFAPQMQTLFIPGDVMAVDSASRTLTVRRRRMKTEEMFGRRWYQEAGDRCHLFNPAYQGNYQQLDKALAEYEKDPVVKLHVPIGSSLYRNGRFQGDFSQIRPGDQVSYSYPITPPPIQPPADRASFFGSTAVYVSGPLRSDDTNSQPVESLTHPE